MWPIQTTLGQFHSTIGSDTPTTHQNTQQMILVYSQNTKKGHFDVGCHCSMQAFFGNRAESLIWTWPVLVALGQFGLIIWFWQHILVLLHKNLMASRQLWAKWTKQCPAQSQQCSIQLSERVSSHLVQVLHGPTQPARCQQKVQGGVLAGWETGPPMLLHY